MSYWNSNRDCCSSVVLYLIPEPPSSYCNVFWVHVPNDCFLRSRHAALTTCTYHTVSNKGQFSSNGNVYILHHSLPELCKHLFQPSETGVDLQQDYFFMFCILHRSAHHTLDTSRSFSKDSSCIDASCIMLLTIIVNTLSSRSYNFLQACLLFLMIAFVVLGALPTTSCRQSL